MMDFSKEVEGIKSEEFAKFVRYSERFVKMDRIV